MKTGLILEGGAMRGLYTAGVLDVMMEQKIDVDGVIGVSAGAVFGCNYKSRQIGRTLRYNSKYAHTSEFGGIRSLIKTGDFYNRDFCYRRIPFELDPFDVETFGSNPIDFYVVATNVITGNPVYHRCTDGKEEDLEWMRASASMPLVSNIVEIDGFKLLDGGISDSIPIHFFHRIGYQRNIIILTRDASYRKKPGRMNFMFRFLMKQYPAVGRVMKKRHLQYNRQVKLAEQLARNGKALLIRPSKPLTISRTETDPKKLKETYDLGRRDAMERLEEIRAFLAKAKER